jgi:hypothetical protein
VPVLKWGLVKDMDVIFCLNNASSIDDFIFWLGSEKYDVASVGESILALPTVFIPTTQLFDLASTTGEVIYDIAKYSKFFESRQDARAKLYEMAKGNIDEFKKLSSRYDMSEEMDDFITTDLASLGKAILVQ